MGNNITEIAKKVLKDEAEGIALLDNFFDDNFSAAVNKILKISGKVIVTGVGNPVTLEKRFLQHYHLPEHPHILSIPQKRVTGIWVWLEVKI